MIRTLWILTYTVIFVWSAVAPKDYFTWALEVAPAVIGVIVLAVTYNSFRLTGLLYGLILIHCIVLMVGGHYTYAEVPLFDQLATATGSERNNYDKLGHFFQGFVPAILAREILIRKAVVKSPGWRHFFIISICLAFSAFYELIEWGVAVGTGESAEAFLGTQGYAWDTQSDMALALLGAVTALSTLGRLHDKQLNWNTDNSLEGVSMEIKAVHKASCHCGAVEFELALPNGLEDPRRCDCSMCRRRGAIVASVPLDGIKIIKGEEMLSLYQFNTMTAKHYFCSRCGIYTHHQRRSNPDQYGFNVACLEGVNPFELGEVPTHDGINHPADRQA